MTTAAALSCWSRSSTNTCPHGLTMSYNQGGEPYGGTWRSIDVERQNESWTRMVTASGEVEEARELRPVPLLAARILMRSESLQGSGREHHGLQRIA